MTPTSRYTPSPIWPDEDDGRPTVEIGMVVALPRPANFLRQPMGPADKIQEGTPIDVASLSLEELQKVGEAIKQNFIENAMKRRQRRGSP